MNRLKRNIIIFSVLSVLFLVSIIIDKNFSPTQPEVESGTSSKATRNPSGTIVAQALVGHNERDPYNEFYPSMEETVKGDKVKVAAIQCHSPMGRLGYNRRILTELITRAASKGAKIIVTPECAVSGYMNPLDQITWAEDKPNNRELPVQLVGEQVPGASTKYFGEIAAKEKIYLCISLVEKFEKKFYNTQVLLDPEGKIVGHHRKQNLWSMGDLSWATPGNRKAQVIATPYGKLGLMICYDVHLMPEKLKALEADLVLYSVGWYGGNGKNWFRHIFPVKHVKPNNFAVISANWAAPNPEDSWEGSGYSTIYAATGKVLSSAKATGNGIIYAELPVKTK